MFPRWGAVVPVLCIPVSILANVLAQFAPKIGFYTQPEYNPVSEFFLLSDSIMMSLFFKVSLTVFSDFLSLFYPEFKPCLLQDGSS
jgi:hypothetical protein